MRIPKGGIAFFDSGIGGLTVLNSFLDYCERLKKASIETPNINTLYYYGDNFRAPYGNLDNKQIFEYVEEAFECFKKLEVRAAVIACNTVTTVCIEKLRKKYLFPIVGTEPAVFQAAKEGGEIFVLATKATCCSNRLKILCESAKSVYPDATIKIYPCENLAKLIECGSYPYDFDYPKILPQGKPSAVVLGCTHYIYIKKNIQSYYQCKIFDGNEGISKRLTELLREKDNFSNFSEKNEKIKPLMTTTSFLPSISLKNRQIYFLGGGKMVNKTKYEQMFALK